MRIGELARSSGMTASTIRFYERRGVLRGPGRQANGYRAYTQRDLERVRTFARLRDLGLDAEDASRLADQCATDRCDLTWSELPPLLASQRATIAARIDELRRLDARLAALEGQVATGRSVPQPRHREEDRMLRCDDDVCCGPNGPCC